MRITMAGDAIVEGKSGVSGDGLRSGESQMTFLAQDFFVRPSQDEARLTVVETGCAPPVRRVVATGALPGELPLVLIVVAVRAPG